MSGSLSFVCILLRQFVCRVLVFSCVCLFVSSLIDIFFILFIMFLILHDLRFLSPTPHQIVTKMQWAQGQCCPVLQFTSLFCDSILLQLLSLLAAILLVVLLPSISIYSSDIIICIIQ